MLLRYASFPFLWYFTKIMGAGPNGQEDEAFVAALGVKGDAFRKKCKSQVKGEENVSARREIPMICMASLAVILGLILG